MSESAFQEASPQPATQPAGVHARTGRAGSRWLRTSFCLRNETGKEQRHGGRRQLSLSLEASTRGSQTPRWKLLTAA